VWTQRHREAIRLRSSRWLRHRRAEAQTTDQQLDRLRAHAEGQGWSVPADRVFRDDGYSGASLKRPGLDRLRDVAASARLDRILITEPDRLARNFVHQTLLVEELQKHGAEVAFLDRPLGTAFAVPPLRGRIARRAIAAIRTTSSCCKSAAPSPSMSAP
jgi:site-specific DNA recombinase